MSVPTDRGKRGKGHRMVPFPPLDSPKPSFEPLSEAFAAKRGLRGLGSVRRGAYGTLYCPEFTLRYPPRITVRGHPVQGVCFARRKAPLPSSVYPWSTKRPCGPLAFRRATGGSRVPRRVWGVKRGKGTIGALSPLVSAARRRHSPAAGRRQCPACPSAATHRLRRQAAGTAEINPLPRVRRRGSCPRQGETALIHGKIPLFFYEKC